MLRGILRQIAGLMLAQAQRKLSAGCNLYKEGHFLEARPCLMLKLMITSKTSIFGSLHFFQIIEKRLANLKKYLVVGFNDGTDCNCPGRNNPDYLL